MILLGNLGKFMRVLCPKCGAANVRAFLRGNRLGEIEAVRVVTNCPSCGKNRSYETYEGEIITYFKEQLYPNFYGEI